MLNTLCIIIRNYLDPSEHLKKKKKCIEFRKCSQPAAGTIVRGRRENVVIILFVRWNILKSYSGRGRGERDHMKGEG